MNTDQLIAAISADGHPPRRSIAYDFAIATALGGGLSLALLTASIGLRSDLSTAFESWRFALKLVIVGSILLLALYDCVRLTSPLPTALFSRWNLAIPLLIGAAITVDVMDPTIEPWTSRLIGSNALICLIAIPLLSVAPLVAGLWAMRLGAPTRPALAGAAVGRFAAAVAAAVYALHCTDDSPMFVATWYGLAAVLPIGLGALIGRSLLRW